MRTVPLVAAPVHPTAATPFPHDPSCRTRDAAPEWERVEEGHFKRTCSCHVDNWYAAPERPTAPDVAAHRHSTDENDAPCDAKAKAVFDEHGGFWKTRCKECGTTQTYWSYHRRVMADGTFEPLPVGTTFVPGDAT